MTDNNILVFVFVPVSLEVGTANQHSVAASGLEQLNCSFLGGTILTPADMDISANKTVTSEPLQPLPPAVPVAFTSSSNTGRYQPVPEQQYVAPPVQQASMPGPYLSQWYTSQATTERNCTNGERNVPAIQPYAAPYSSNRAVHSGIPSGVISVPIQSTELVTPWIPNENMDQRGLRIEYEPPLRKPTVPSTLSKINSPYFGTQLRQELPNALPTSVCIPASQTFPSCPVSGQYSVLQLFPPGIVPPHQSPVTWPVQQPRSAVHPTVQYT